MGLRFVGSKMFLAATQTFYYTEIPQHLSPLYQNKKIEIGWLPPPWRLTLYVNDPLLYSNLDCRITEKPCIISYYVSFQLIISLSVRLMGSQTGWYLRSGFEKLIFCSVQLSQPVTVTLKCLHTQLNIIFAHYMEVWGHHQPLFNLVSFWVYTKHCQGTFKRIKKPFS